MSPGRADFNVLPVESGFFGSKSLLVFNKSFPLQVFPFLCFHVLLKRRLVRTKKVRMKIPTTSVRKQKNMKVYVERVLRNGEAHSKSRELRVAV